MYGYLVLFIIRPFENWRFLGALHLERIYGVLMVAALLLWQHRRSIRSPQTTAVFAFLGCAGLSVIFAYRPRFAWVGFYIYCTYVVFYVVILATIKNEKELRGFVVVYMCTMTVYQLLSLREYLFFGRGIWSGGIWRLCGFDSSYGHPNSVAASIAYSMPFAFAMLRGDAQWRIRLAIAGYSILSFICIVLTGSRSGLLTYLLVCLLYVFSLRGKRRLFAAAVLPTFLLLAWPLIPGEKQARMRTLFGQHMNPGEQGSAEGRIKGWGFFEGLKMLQDRPLLGVGMACFIPYAREQLGGPAKDSHNLYGEVLGQLGILGTFAFVCVFAITFANALAVIVEVRRGTVPRASPVARVAWAIPILLILLLFEGWASHNLYRYNWLWAAAMGVLAKDFAFRNKEPANGCCSREGKVTK